MNEQNYSVDEILDLKFKKKFIGGIDPDQVDDVLDQICDDYEVFIKKINELKRINEELRNENFRVKMNVLKTATNTLDLDGEDQELSDAHELVMKKRQANLNKQPVKDTVDVQAQLQKLMADIEELKKSK